MVHKEILITFFRFRTSGLRSETSNALKRFVSIYCTGIFFFASEMEISALLAVRFFDYKSRRAFAAGKKIYLVQTYQKKNRILP